jgi:hypothetical protein
VGVDSSIHSFRGVLLLASCFRYSEIPAKRGCGSMISLSGPRKNKNVVTCIFAYFLFVNEGERWQIRFEEGCVETKKGYYRCKVRGGMPTAE